MTTPARIAVLALYFGLTALSAEPSLAAARKGGHFVGGYGPHHRGGHEVGGRVAHHPIRNFLRRL